MGPHQPARHGGDGGGAPHGLSMPAKEDGAPPSAYAYVTENTAQSWAAKYVGALREIADKNNAENDASLKGAAADPAALAADVAAHVAGGALAVFTDYDGTLTPIVDDPDAALLPPAAEAQPTRPSGGVPHRDRLHRSRGKIGELIPVEGPGRGSHGFEIAAAGAPDERLLPPRGALPPGARGGGGGAHRGAGGGRRRARRGQHLRGVGALPQRARRENRRRGGGGGGGAARAAEPDAAARWSSSSAPCSSGRRGRRSSTSSPSSTPTGGGKKYFRSTLATTLRRGRLHLLRERDGPGAGVLVDARAAAHVDGGELPRAHARRRPRDAGAAARRPTPRPPPRRTTTRPSRRRAAASHIPCDPSEPSSSSLYRAAPSLARRNESSQVEACACVRAVYSSYHRYSKLRWPTHA